MNRPRLLDLFSGAGGAARGYQHAGFHTTGVDHKPQPHYTGDAFIQADALTYAAEHGHEYDAIHASPPCQHYSVCHRMPSNRQRHYPDLIDDVRTALQATHRPWVIENVPGSPLRTYIMLCGQQFPQLLVYRHRWFESSLLLFALPHAPHTIRIKKGKGGILAHYVNTVGNMVTVAGCAFGLAAGRRAMGIDWMTRRELSQAIPPPYTHFVGLQLLRALEESTERETTL